MYSSNYFLKQTDHLETDLNLCPKACPINFNFWKLYFCSVLESAQFLSVGMDKKDYNQLNSVIKYYWLLNLCPINIFLYCVQKFYIFGLYLYVIILITSFNFIVSYQGILGFKYLQHSAMLQHRFRYSIVNITRECDFMPNSEVSMFCHLVLYSIILSIINYLKALSFIPVGSRACNLLIECPVSFKPCFH